MIETSITAIYSPECELNLKSVKVHLHTCSRNTICYDKDAGLQYPPSILQRITAHNIRIFEYLNLLVHLVICITTP